MNPEAAAWLEGLSGDDHLALFRPPAGEPGKLFGVKEDHEPGRLCFLAGCTDVPVTA
jgi:hypothetical protein